MKVLGWSKGLYSVQRENSDGSIDWAIMDHNENGWDVWISGTEQNEQAESSEHNNHDASNTSQSNNVDDGSWWGDGNWYDEDKWLPVLPSDYGW